MRNFFSLYFLCKAAAVRYFIRKILNLSTKLDLCVNWRSNYILLYLASTLFLVFTAATDMIYLINEYLMDLSFESKTAFVLLWIVYIAQEAALLYFFWMVTYVLTQALCSVGGKVMDWTKSCANQRTKQNLKDALLSGEFEYEISNLDLAVLDFMDLMGCLCLFRCMYDMISTTLSLFFFVSYMGHEWFNAFNMLVVFSGRALGILALASSAENFNKMVRS